MRESLLIGLFVAGSAFATDNVYKIPVKDEMKAWATFEIKDAEIRVRKSGRVDIEYSFPSELIGEKNFKIEARGYSDDLSQPVQLRGTFGRFDCRILENRAACNVKYNPKTLPVLLPGGVDKVKEYLKATLTDEKELSARFAVVEVFSHEAAGTFENLRVRFDR